MILGPLKRGRTPHQRLRLRVLYSFAAVLCLPFLLVQHLPAWGPLGHSTIAAVAEKHLSPDARAHIATILAQSHDADLPAIANWADEVRAAASGRGPLSDDAEARAFNAKFPTNALWHFVDLPLGTQDYRQVLAFTSVNDVVHAIKRCVAVLERAQTRPEDFTTPQALRLLVHFVGDIHQPLHCGTGFYELSDLTHPVLITDPKKCRGKPNDRGGNDLFFGSDSNQQLHALWDDSLVFAISNSADYRSLAGWLESTQSPSPPTGDYHHWPEQWASDSVQQAQKAYKDIAFGSATLDGQRLRITIQLPDHYVDTNSAIAAQQLAAAGLHLAALLNAIKWP
jgi:S1/P1 Nuclease